MNIRVSLAEVLQSIQNVMMGPIREIYAIDLDQIP